MPSSGLMCWQYVAVYGCARALVVVVVAVTVAVRGEVAPMLMLTVGPARRGVIGSAPRWTSDSFNKRLEVAHHVLYFGGYVTGRYAFSKRVQIDALRITCLKPNVEHSDRHFCVQESELSFERRPICVELAPRLL
jgi:hypothetical protein